MIKYTTYEKNFKSFYGIMLFLFPEFARCYSTVFPVDPGKIITILKTGCRCHFPDTPFRMFLHNILRRRKPFFNQHFLEGCTDMFLQIMG